MKKLLFSLVVASGLAAATYAGVESYSSKDKVVKETAAAPAFCEWYRDTEWNVSLWGTYAFTFNDWPQDTYFQMDHAWGGGIDAKYFFRRYFGLGIEGALFQGERHVDVFDDTTQSFSVRQEDQTLGMIKGTFTVRYPIGCSRFAPYVFGGVGAVFGGHGDSFEIINIDDDDDEGDFFDIDDGDQDAELVGQVGGGLEIRLTPNIGLINDFSYNIIDGGDNNFGMFRSGINFAF